MNNRSHTFSARKGVQEFAVNFGLFLTCASSVMKMLTFSESEIKHFDKVGLAPLPCGRTVAPAMNKNKINCPLIPTYY